MKKIREQTRKRVVTHRAKKKEEEKHLSCPQKVTSRYSNAT